MPQLLSHAWPGHQTVPGLPRQLLTALSCCSRATIQRSGQLVRLNLPQPLSSMMSPTSQVRPDSAHHPHLPCAARKLSNLSTILLLSRYHPAQRAASQAQPAPALVIDDVSDISNAARLCTTPSHSETL